MSTVSVAGIKLPVNKSKKYVPGQQVYFGQEEELKRIAVAVRDNIPALIIGETGLGKTALIRHLAYETESGFRRLNLNGQTSIDEFVGRTLLGPNGTYWQDGVLIEAMREGYWLLLDEVNAALPEILFVLHSLLDDDRYVVLSEKDGEIVRPHANFRLFATMNPSGKYTGTKELNKAFLSRFPMILQMDYPEAKEEVEIIRAFSNVDKNTAVSLVKMANDLRETYQKDEIDFSCSTRDLISVSQITEKLSLKDGIELSILNRANEDDEKAVRAVVTLYFGSDFKAKEYVDHEKKYQAAVAQFNDIKKMSHEFQKDLVSYVHEIESLNRAIKDKGVAAESRRDFDLLNSTLHEVAFYLEKNANSLSGVAMSLDEKASALQEIQ